MIGIINGILMIAGVVAMLFVIACLHDAIVSHLPGTTIGALAGAGVFILVSTILNAVCAFNAND